jgi:hypothetical protein
LKGTFSHAKNYAYLSHHEEGTIPSSLLWHARFGHINYDNLSGFLTIPRNLKQCDPCILGKHNKQHFHDSTFVACRKLGLIYFDLCGPVHVPTTNENIYIYNGFYLLLHEDVLSVLVEGKITNF